MAQPDDGTQVQVLGGMVPPHGVTPNFVDPYSLQPVLIAMFAFYLAISTATTLLRMYTKLYISKNPGWGDYTACIALLGYIVYCACVFSTLPYGAGIHQWDVPLTDLVPFARPFTPQHAIAAEIVYPPAIFFAKLSVFLQFIHFFIPDHGSKSFYVVWAFIIFNFLYLAVSMFLFALQCRPLALLWDPTLPGHCLNKSTLYITVAGVILFSDFTMLLLPLTWIWRSMMSTKNKIGVSAVFAIGAVACVASVLHLFYSVRAYGSGDQTFILAQLTFATGGEIASAILCTNLPILPRFFRSMAPKISTLLTRMRSKSKSSSSDPQSHANRSSKKKAPLSSWARFGESIPQIFKPNHLGLETRDLKPGIRTLIEEDLHLETTNSADELEYREKELGDLECGLEKERGF
ncbi:hypothetical protein MMC12_001783 [Toensbergia leucococca]|nr:hypothetical protein [Toensbergia leucococca]